MADNEITPEEFVERIKRGLIEPETREGTAIMVDEEKGEYGFELYGFKDFPSEFNKIGFHDVYKLREEDWQILFPPKVSGLEF